MSWEQINGFSSPAEFERFRRWIADRVSDGLAEAVDVEAPYGGVTSQPEHWYRCSRTGETWRLVEPDPPSLGLFARVNPARPGS